MPTLFTRIIEGEIPGTFVWRDDQCVAFLSINPLRRGHTLVVPKLEIDHWIDCPPELSNHLFTVAGYIGVALQTVLQPTRVGLSSTESPISWGEREPSGRRPLPSSSGRA